MIDCYVALHTLQSCEHFRFHTPPLNTCDTLLYGYAADTAVPSVINFVITIPKPLSDVVLSSPLTWLGSLSKGPLIIVSFRFVGISFVLSPGAGHAVHASFC